MAKSGCRYRHTLSAISVIVGHDIKIWYSIFAKLVNLSLTTIFKCVQNYNRFLTFVKRQHESIVPVLRNQFDMRELRQYLHEPPIVVDVACSYVGRPTAQVIGAFRAAYHGVKPLGHR